MGGAEGLQHPLLSPPAPRCSWPHQLFPGSVWEEDGARQALAGMLRAVAAVPNGALSRRRLGPLYASARLLWLLLGLAVAGLLAHFALPRSSAWTAALAWPLQLLGAP